MSVTIRHSALPKLAQCPTFEGSPATSGAASRGTTLDAAYRAGLQGDLTLIAALPDADQSAVLWAMNKTLELADGSLIITDEDDLKVSTPGMDHIGTEDARLQFDAVSFDLKSGQLRSYYEQMAAYAYGNMDSTFVTEWTCHLIFCDQQEVTTHVFSYEGAKALVEGIIARATDPAAAPSACDYCGWCARKDTCLAVTQPVVETLARVDSTVSLEEMKTQLLADPTRLGKFLSAVAIFTKELVTPIKDAAKEKLEAGEEIPGWKQQTVAGSEYFDHLAIVRTAHSGKAGLDSLVLAMGGTMSGKDFRAWSETLRTPVDDSLARRKDGFSKLVEAKGKKSK